MKRPRILAALAAALVATTFACADATLVHRYEFNGTLNDSVGSIHGVASGAGLYSEAPSYGSITPAGAVGPDQSLLVGQTPGIRSGFTVTDTPYLATSGSISLWFRYDAAANEDYLLSVGGFNDGLQLVFNSATSIYFRLGGTNVGSKTSLVANQWYHIGLTWDVSTTSAAFYFNGALVSSTSNVTGTINPFNKLDVANFGHPANPDSASYVANQFQGAIYDLQIYSGQLDATEISTLAGNPGTAVIPEPSSWAALCGAFALGVTAFRRRSR